jgi:hypothetical protein
MKHNRKTLKRKSLLKKRKGGKTLRRKTRRIKGGIPFIPDMGILSKIRGNNSTQNKVDEKLTCPIQSNQDCCYDKSTCQKGQYHEWLKSGPHLGLPPYDRELTFSIETKRVGYDEAVQKKGVGFLYCSNCQKIKC